MAWKSSFRQNYRTSFSPTVPTSATGISHVVADVEAPGGEMWEHLKSGGKQWQATPKNLPRIQRTRAIPVAWLTSGLCPDRPKGWIPIIINNRVLSWVKRDNDHSTPSSAGINEWNCEIAPFRCLRDVDRDNLTFTHTHTHTRTRTRTHT